MRDILVEEARRRASVKRGGGFRRICLESVAAVCTPSAEDLVALDEALRQLEREDQRKADIVFLRYFAGLSQAETADVLGISRWTVAREWRYIIARLQRDMACAAQCKCEQ